MPYTDDYIDHVFSYHPPQAGQPEVYEAIRTHAREFFRVINRLVPDGADKADALRSLRNCVMTANAGIATAGGPKPFQDSGAPIDGPSVTKLAGTIREVHQTTLGTTAAVRGTTLPTGIGTASSRGKSEGKPLDGLVDDYLNRKGIR